MAQGSVKAKVWVVATLVVGVAACSEPAPPPPAPPPPAAAAPPPAPVLAPPQALASRDSCGADPLQYLVGRPRTEIPVPVNPSLRRVVCSTCVVTQDYVAARQTIVYDAQTGLVRSVRCG